MFLKNMLVLITIRGGGYRTGLINYAMCGWAVLQGGLF